MVISTRELGSTIRPTEKVPISISMGHDMKGNGKTIFSMARERKHGLMAVSMMEITLQARSMAMVYTAGTMEVGMKVNGMRTRFGDSGFTAGSMAESTRENGWTTIWKAWVFTHGKTVVSTVDSTMMTRSMALAFIHGQIIESTKAYGYGGSSMVSESTQYQAKTANAVSGRMERESNGSLKSKQSRLSEVTLTMLNTSQSRNQLNIV
jgi:hypothetical protein